MANKHKKYNFKKAKIINLIILSIFFILVVFFIHPFGMPEAVRMDDYFIKNAQRQTGSNNVVSSIVFDYRGLDTLGEATVLFAAILGISLIFTPLKILTTKKKRRKRLSLAAFTRNIFFINR